MLKRFEQQKAIFVNGLKCLGYSVKTDEDFEATLSNGTNWDFRFEGDPRDDFFLPFLINNKTQKDFGLNVLMQVFLWEDPCEGILYCTLGGSTMDQYELSHLEVDFILKNRECLFDDAMEYEEKYDKLNVVPWWMCIDGTPPDLSFLYD